MEFYPVGLRFRSLCQYVLWFNNDVDGVHTTNGGITVFVSELAARSFALANNLPVSSSSQPVLDLDGVKEDAFKIDTIDCVAVLNIWNFLADLAASLPEKASTFLALDRRPSTIYDKVFWGNNLPAVTPKDEHYTPAFSITELSDIKAILFAGLDLFAANLRS